MAMAAAAIANSSLEKQQIDAEIAQVRAEADAKVALIEAKGKAAAMQITATAEAERINTVSKALEQACAPAQTQELIRASGGVLNSSRSTIMLAQDTGALATLLSGPRGYEATR